MKYKNYDFLNQKSSFLKTMKILKTLFIKFILKSRKRLFLVKKNLIFKSLINKPNYKILSFGSKNKNKIFYVIKRFGGGGFFSNFLFVLNHLIIADKFKFIPVVDMENFTNFYTEKKIINGNKNVWEFFFEKVSKYNLKEVYNSQNVILTDDLFYNEMSTNYRQNSKNLFKVYKKYIKIKPFVKKTVESFIKKNFLNNKVLAVHWRGTDHKVLPKHPLPPTKKQIFKKVDTLINKNKYNKIFLVTEDKKNFEDFVKYYGNKVCYYKSFRTNKTKDFDNFNRKNHKFNLARESLVEVMILSKLDIIVCSKSNISEIGVFMSNKKFKVHEIYNGFNTNSLIWSLFYWHIRSKLPTYFGGFK